MQLKGAQWASIGARKAFKGGGRALTAAGRVSKTMRKASRADEPRRQLWGILGGKE